jgi:DNA polymerase III subunit delta'
VSQATAAPPKAILEATGHQPAARVALAAALAAPVHAYLFSGPPGAGKRAAARAFAAELLAAGAPDPDDARRRALAEPSPHPDLVWLVPPGTQHLVDEVRRRVITAAAYRPFEGSQRVFVIEAAEAMADESQNALLKTLEEPADFVHLVLITAEPELLLETVRSRCQPVRFAPLDPEVVEARLGGVGGAEERRAVARLSGGDTDRAAFLLTEEGRALRAAARASVEAAAAGDLAERPWDGLLDASESAGARATADSRRGAAALGVEAQDTEGPGARRRSRESDDAARRAGRRARSEALDLGLALLAAWLRDVAASGEGAGETVLNVDELDAVRAIASEADPRRARRGAELVMDSRRRLTVNVAEELALEALMFRLQSLLNR